MVPEEAILMPHYVNKHLTLELRLLLGNSKYIQNEEGFKDVLMNQ